MEAFPCRRALAIAIMAVLLAFVSLAGDVAAQEGAPAPAPTSASIGISPSLSAAFVVSFAAFLFEKLFH
ncbi:hypothetical protein ACLOJK_040024 [Asimina triloba]